MNQTTVVKVTESRIFGNFLIEGHEDLFVPRPSVEESTEPSGTYRKHNVANVIDEIDVDRDVVAYTPYSPEAKVKIPLNHRQLFALWNNREALMFLFRKLMRPCAGRGSTVILVFPGTTFIKKQGSETIEFVFGIMCHSQSSVPALMKFDKRVSLKNTESILFLSMFFNEQSENIMKKLLAA